MFGCSFGETTKGLESFEWLKCSEKHCHGGFGGSEESDDDEDRIA